MSSEAQSTVKRANNAASLRTQGIMRASSTLRCRAQTPDRPEIGPFRRGSHYGSHYNCAGGHVKTFPGASLRTISKVGPRGKDGVPTDEGACAWRRRPRPTIPTRGLPALIPISWQRPVPGVRPSALFWAARPAAGIMSRPGGTLGYPPHVGHTGSINYLVQSLALGSYASTAGEMFGLCSQF
jgi:hypothetical protein